MEIATQFFFFLLNQEKNEIVVILFVNISYKDILWYKMNKKYLTRL